MYSRRGARHTFNADGEARKKILSDAILECRPRRIPLADRRSIPLFCVYHQDAYPAGNDEMGPATSLDGRNIGQDFEGKDGWRMYHGDLVPGFPEHPHRGFETVTVVRRGFIDHADSCWVPRRVSSAMATCSGSPPDKGISHSEMFPLRNRSGSNETDFFQIWLNLPRASKLVEPYFSMLWRDAIPKYDTRDAAGRAVHVEVIAGALGEIKTRRAATRLLGRASGVRGRHLDDPARARRGVDDPPGVERGEPHALLFPRRNASCGGPRSAASLQSRAPAGRRGDDRQWGRRERGKPCCFRGSARSASPWRSKGRSS